MYCRSSTIWHVIQFHHYSKTGNLLRAKRSNLQSTQQNSTKMAALLREDKKIDPRKILHKNFKTRFGKLKKRLLPGSGETDWACAFPRIS